MSKELPTLWVVLRGIENNSYILECIQGDNLESSKNEKVFCHKFSEQLDAEYDFNQVVMEAIRGCKEAYLMCEDNNISVTIKNIVGLKEKIIKLC